VPLSKGTAAIRCLKRPGFAAWPARALLLAWTSTRMSPPTSTARVRALWTRAKTTPNTPIARAVQAGEAEAPDASAPCLDGSARFCGHNGVCRTARAGLSAIHSFARATSAALEGVRRLDGVASTADARVRKTSARPCAPTRPNGVRSGGLGGSLLASDGGNTLVGSPTSRGAPGSAEMGVQVSRRARDAVINGRLQPLTVGLWSRRHTGVSLH
jgi:hypothetical protein